MQKLTVNTFQRGRNTDADPNILDPTYYVEAHNVELVGDGSFFALKNIKGTTNVQDIINVADTEVLGVFETKYKIGSTTGVKCLTIITATTGGNFKIYCYDTENDTLYELFEEPTPNNYLTDDRVIDAKGYAENGIDILYLTDFFNEIRQLRCEIPSPYSANFLNSYDLSLLRRGASGDITLDSVSSTGGSLLSGSYQFAYRMADPDKKKFTKWSGLTNPIHVYDSTDSNQSYAGIGLPTSSKITIDIVPSQEELDNFDFFQLAVIENVYPLGAESVVEGQNTIFVASLLPIEANSALSNYEYKSNSKIGTVPVEDLVVDLAAIEAVKTLAADRSRLVFGNIKYHDLEFDNGEPTISGGSIATAVDATSTVYYQAGNSSTKRGYFRDEVYRFGIVYFDKYGNKSPVKVLDLSSVTGNQISGATDMKFPGRDVSNSYSLLDSNDSPRALGLNLTGVDNHPTWAVGFEIVRVPRIKRILFQTPVVPMMEIEGIGAFRRYPSLANVGDDDEDTKEYTDAQPMTSSKVYVPKNLFWPELRKIQRRTTSVGSDNFNKRKKGESRLARQSTYDYAAIFPQQDLYSPDNPFIFLGNEKLEPVDFCAVKLNLQDYSDFPDPFTDAGNHINTKLGGTFHALRTGDYFFDSAWAAKSISETPAQVTDYAQIPAFSDGTTLAGEKILTHDDLQTDGIPLGFKPNNQKLSVIKLKESLPDDGSTSRTFANTTLNNYSGGARVFGATGPTYETDNGESPGGSYSNAFIFDRANYSSSSYVNVLRIANLIRGDIGDDRYGDAETEHKFISTGARYTFTPSELVDVAAGNSVPKNITVWGGDCFVGYHVFKICDSTYSVVNQEKNNGTADSNSYLREAWNDILFSIPISGVNPNPKICMPVALEKVAQHIQIFLESEYNGEVMDYDVLGEVTTISNTPVLNVLEEGSLRTPLTYKYNINLSKQNDQKVFVPRPQYNFIQNEFQSRIQYTDPKIYNSSEQGFDVVRVQNFYDLEESGGPVNSLAKAGDALYALQERRISYLSTGQNILEQGDANTIAIGTSDFIGNVIVIDTNRGCQHLRGVVETGGVIFIPDKRNKAIYKLSEQNLEIISSINNETEFRALLSASIPEKNMLGIYDPIRKEYWFIDNANHECHVFNEGLNQWVANYEFSSAGKLLGGVYANQQLYLLGKVLNQISAYTMYTGTYSQLFGQTVTPRVKFIVNPDGVISKTFDNQAFVATERLASVDLLVNREQLQGNQSGTILVDNTAIEGNYRIKTLRDADNARLRGLRMYTTVKWKTTDLGSSLSSVMTKYRLSSRTPF